MGASPDLKRCATCGNLIPAMTQICPKCLRKRALFARLYSHAAPYKGTIAASVTLSALTALLDLTSPYLTKVLIDGVLTPAALEPGLTQERQDLLLKLVGALLAIHVLTALFGMVRSYLMEFLGERVTSDLRSAVFATMQKLPLRFFDQKQSGNLLNRVTGDTERLQMFISEGLPELVVDALMLLGIGVIMFWMSPFLALLALIPMPLVLLATWMFNRNIRNIYSRVWRSYGALSAYLGDVLPGMRVVKAFAKRDLEIAHFDRQNNELFQRVLETVRVSSVFHPSMHLLFSLGFVMLWGVGGWQILAGRPGLSVGVLVAFVGYMWRFYGPIQRLSRVTQQLQRAATSSERIFEILDTPVEDHDRADLPLMPRLRGRVEFRGVHFHYDPEKPVLRDIDLTIEPGELIGVVGPSGVGKSTLVNLIPRLYEPHRGTILIDGLDVRDHDRLSLRRQVGMVLQEPYLFHGTIKDNIAYGRPDAREIDILEAAKAANAHEFIMKLPEAYDSEIGERGVRLSGGEIQRVSIARAILNDPRILILDEATSSVDTMTEKLIQEAIHRLVKGRTTVAIAHRLSTLRHADRIVVLKGGAIEEIGSHDELLERDGLYAELCRIQAEAAAIRAV